LRFVFKFPSKIEDLEKLMELTIYYIDLVATVSLKSRDKNILKREAAVLSEKQKANKEKEIEMRKKRKEEKIEKEELKKRKKVEK
jgi:hypothetical protein